MRLKFREVQAVGTNPGVIVIQIAFEATRLKEVTGGVSETEKQPETEPKDESAVGKLWLGKHQG